MTKRNLNFKTAAALAAFLGLAAAPNASALMVSHVNDTNAATGFGTTIDVTGNTLTFDVSAFLVEASPIEVLAPMNDTLSFKLWAPDGYYIDEIIYSESLLATMDGDGLAYATADIVVDGTGYSVGSHIFENTSAHTLSTIPVSVGLEMVEISIFNQISAISLGGDVSLQKGVDVFGNDAAPTLTASVAPIPLPPAIWLLGAALLGLLAVRRNSLKP